MQDWRHSYQEIRSLLEKGRATEAVKQAERSVGLHGGNYPLWELLGISARRAGMHDLAVRALTRAVTTDPAQPTGHNNLGNALRDVNQYRSAVEAYQRAIALKPDYPEAHNNLGAVRRLLGDVELALSSCQRAVALRPNYAEAHHNSGMALCDLSRKDEAIVAFRSAIAFNPTLAEAHYHLGNALSDTECHEEAIASYRDATAAAPHFPEAHYSLANALRDAGSLEEAAQHYRAALESRPTFATGWRTATSMAAFHVDTNTLEQLKLLKQDTTLSDLDHCELGFALYQTCNRLNRLEEGFDFLLEANASRRAQLGYEPTHDSIVFKDLSIECAHWLAEPNATMEPSPYQPIFIVGMPRSGTTLVEHIISSHSGVRDLGELPFARAAVLPLLDRAGTAIKERAADIRHHYLTQVAGRLPAAGAFTDKMPQNFLWLPMLMRAFPDAKFVHVYREPRATCWSLYERFFPAGGLDFSYDLSDVAHYYGLYRDWMEWLSPQLGARLFHLNYEQLTVDPKHTIEQLANYLALSLEDGMLAPHQNARWVRTASNEQIRRPIYASSSNQWNLFEHHVGAQWGNLVPFSPPDTRKG